MRNLVRLMPALLLVLGALPVAGEEPPGQERPALVVEPGEFDPAAWDELLVRFVHDGRVAYAAWKEAGTAELDAFLQAAADYDLKSVLGKEPRAAFLINAYNAVVVRQVLEHYPVDSVRDIEGFFDGRRWKIAGEERTLDDIEAAVVEILRHEPLGLFCLAPGAAGMPPLAPRAYTAENLVALGQQVAGPYITDPEYHRYDGASNTMFLSPLFEEHAAYFEAQQGGLARFLSRFMNVGDVVAVATKNPTFSFLEVDWSLNDVPAAGDAEQ